MSARNVAHPGRAAEIIAKLDTDDPAQAALGVLGLAFRWAADVLSSDEMAAPAEAFRAVAESDEALEAAPAFYAVLSSLVVRGEPAKEVAADLRRHAELSERLDAEIAPLRAKLDALRQAEGQIRKQEARRDAIVAEISELERLARLAAHVDALQKQRDSLLVRTADVRTATSTAEAELAEVAGQLVTLTRAALDDLAEQTRGILLRAAELDAEFQDRLADRRIAADELRELSARATAQLAAVKDELDQARGNYEGARAEAESHRTALARYAKANRDVAEALAGRPADDRGDHHAAADGDPIARALLALDEVQRRLAHVDGLLADVLSPGEG